LLLELPPAQRAVVLLRFQEDLPPGDIAETLGMPLATVKSHLQRALKAMRARAEDTLREYTRHG
jgi:RNA polymerase sigma-70 factor (ECF subfamily)